MDMKNTITRFPISKMLTWLMLLATNEINGYAVKSIGYMMGFSFLSPLGITILHDSKLIFTGAYDRRVLYKEVLMDINLSWIKLIVFIGTQAVLSG